MLRVNKLTDYATEVLYLLARKPGSYTTAIELSAQLNIAQPTVSKVLKALQRAGMLASVRGSAGGYQLMQQPQHINLADVIQVMEGRVAVTDCALGAGLCEHERRCVVRGNWQKVNNAILAVLRSVSLADMARDDMPAPQIVVTTNHTPLTSMTVEDAT